MQKLLLAFLLVLFPVTLVAQQSGWRTVTLRYQSGRGGTGYEDATVDMNYAFYDCFGEATLMYSLRPSTFRPSNTYWLNGVAYPVPAGTRIPRPSAVDFIGTGWHGSQQLASFEDALAGDARNGCNAINRKLGNIPRDLKSNAAITGYLNALSITVSEVPSVYRSQEIEWSIADGIRKQRQDSLDRIATHRRDSIAAERKKAAAVDAAKRTASPTSAPPRSTVGTNSSPAGGSTPASGSAGAAGADGRDNSTDRASADANNGSGHDPAPPPDWQAATAPNAPNLGSTGQQTTAEAVTELAGMLGTIFAGDPAQKAREEAERRRLASLEAQRREAQRQATLRGTGTRPRCTGSEQASALSLGQMQGGRIDGYECRSRGDLSVDAYELVVEREGPVEITLETSGFTGSVAVVSANGTNERDVGSNHEIDLRPGTYRVLVRTSLPGETGSYSLRARPGTQSIVGGITVSAVLYNDTYGSDNAAVRGKSASGGGFRLALGFGDLVQVFGSTSMSGQSTGSFSMDLEGGGARVYAFSRRARWRPFAEFAAYKVSGTYTYGSRTGDFYSWDGNGTGWAVGVERYFAQRFGVEASVNAVQAKLKGVRVGDLTATNRRLQLGGSIHLW